MVFSIGARCIAHSFNIRFGILSGPDAFAGFTNLISDSKGKTELLLYQFKSVFTKTNK
jgi:hypothetical protein